MSMGIDELVRYGRESDEHRIEAGLELFRRREQKRERRKRRAERASGDVARVRQRAHQAR